ncbi:LAETG motif-containing sortase-dependent surface protein [Streptomyces sp. NPDC014006]|uniref:LAETG motif-containing sortase-dependent surface protein n=1 Tax=Streptomyces sp. NPDC014006 TaxID=3364870 RepID=UPI0036F6130E
MSSARRSLLTATAAATLLGALWFVPSANASSETPAREQDTTTTQARAATSATDASAVDGSGLSGPQLADTGSPDTTPYVVGGSVFLSLGAGFVVYSVRRERLGF